MKYTWILATGLLMVGCSSPTYESNADLVSQLQQGEQAERIQAARKLEQRGPNASDSVLDIIQIVINEEDHAVRTAAATALNNILEPDQYAALLEQEVDPKDWWRFTETVAQPTSAVATQ